MAGITPTDAMLGQFYYVVFHEMGHAMFDALNVPLFGRPKAAADAFAAYLMLHLGTKEECARVIGHQGDGSDHRGLPTYTVLRCSATTIYCAWPTALTRKRSATCAPRAATTSMASLISHSSTDQA